MKTPKLFLSAFVLAATLANAARAANYALTRIESVKSTGGPIGPLTVTVKYWIQPCAAALVKVVQTPVPNIAGPSAVRPGIAVFVLINDSGRKCMGPVMQKDATFLLPGGDEGYEFYPVQPQ
ncbi:MAG: hypothetical protein HY077_03530 [Elusimicrobia bacterium]|nr:hypothetical protein [Elusimicrobiota bacterium]